MSVFDWFLVGHFVGDVVFQTEWQALNKMKDWRANLSHAAVWTLFIGLAALAAGLPISPALAGWLLVMGLLHGLIDRYWISVAIAKHVKRMQGEPPAWLVIWIDQSLHLLQLVALALLVS